MSATGLYQFDEALRATNIWLKDIMETLRWTERSHAYRALKAVMHEVRDRLPVPLAANFSAQMPLLIRGLFFEGWSPGSDHQPERSLEAFLAPIEKAFETYPGVKAESVAAAVFDVISRHISPGDVDNVLHTMPKAVQELALASIRPHRVPGYEPLRPATSCMNTGRAARYVRSHKEKTMDDLALRDLVEEELEWEPSLDAADIGVSVEDGVVTLHGHVKSFAEKLIAEKAVKRVKGVRAIAEEIEIRLAGRTVLADDEIAARAANLIDWDVVVPAGKVQVKVENGHVTLTGEVDWHYQSDQARFGIANLPGVKGVTNLISVKPPVAATDIKDRIEKALMRNAELEATSIKVAVTGRKVTLDGKVDAWHDREVAERAAWSAPGVTAVEDNLRVA